MCVGGGLGGLQVCSAFLSISLLLVGFDLSNVEATLQRDTPKKRQVLCQEILSEHWVFNMAEEAAVQQP